MLINRDASAACLQQPSSSPSYHHHRHHHAPTRPTLPFDTLGEPRPPSPGSAFAEANCGRHQALCSPPLGRLHDAFYSAVFPCLTAHKHHPWHTLIPIAREARLRGASDGNSGLVGGWNRPKIRCKQAVSYCHHPLQVLTCQ